MSDNTTARRKLERQFGKICMIEQMGIRYIPKEERRKIKGYTKYDDVITFHHIKERAKGGKATPENGALIRGYNHRWLHSLPEPEKQKINDCILEFKASVLQVTGKGVQVEDAKKFALEEVDLSDCITIPVYDNTREDLEKRQKFNRAKTKRECQKEIDEALYRYQNGLDDTDMEL